MSLENNLIEKYKKMIDMNNIICNNTDTTILVDATCTNIFTLNNNAIFNNNVNFLSNLNISGNTIINSDINCTNINIFKNSLINNLQINNNLYVSSNTILNNNVSLLNNLNVSNFTNIRNTLTITSNLNVSGNAIFMGTVSINNLIISGISKIENNLTLYSSLYVSNNSAFINDNTIFSNLYISGSSNFNNGTIISNLTIPSNFIVNGINTINSNLQIDNLAYLYTLSNLSKLNVSSYTIIKGNISNTNSLNISGSSVFDGNLGIINNLNISGSTISNNMNVSTLYVSNNSILNNCQINSKLNIIQSAIFNNNCLFNKNVTLNSNLTITSLNMNQLNIAGKIKIKLNNYTSNYEAYTNGVPLWGLYRTGGIIKIRLDAQPINIKLIGNNNLNIYVNTTYTEPGITAIQTVSTTNDIITNYITSIIASDLGELINTPIQLTGSQIISNTIMDTSIPRTFTITYTSYSNYNYSSTATRTVTVLAIPVITNINLSFDQNNINFSITGQYDTSTFNIILGSTTIVADTLFIGNSIDVSNLSTNINYIITINLKSNNVTLSSSNYTFTIDKLSPILNIANPSLITINTPFNILTSINVVDPPLNNSISITISNVLNLYKDNVEISIPYDGNLDTSTDSYYKIIYKFIDSLGNNSIISFILWVGTSLELQNFSSESDAYFGGIQLNYPYRNGNTATILSRINFMPTFDLTNGFLHIPNVNLSGMPNNDWCIEGWVYPKGSTSSYGPIFFSHIPPIQFHLPNWVPTLWKTYSQPHTNWAANKSLTMNIWNHLAAQKIGTNLYFYINGVLSGTGNLGTAFDSSMTLGTAIRHSASEYNEESYRLLPGLLSYVKVTLGIVYSSNFTPSKYLINNITSSVKYILTRSNKLPMDYITKSVGTITGTVIVDSQDIL